MDCPYCHGEGSQVKDSRPTEDGTVIRRRRICSLCGGRFTTVERVQLRPLRVLKKSGKRVLFEREKLMRSLGIALRKREIDPELIEKAISDIVRQLESSGEPCIPSYEIGALVMKALENIDVVAYIRFASVYHDFQTARDFGKIVEQLAHKVEKTDP